MAARYEIYLRGQGIDGNPAVPLCAGYEATDPYQEKRMRVQSNFQKWPGMAGWQNQF